MASLVCSRCGRQGEPTADRLLLPQELAERVLASVCADCWGEWLDEEIRVINELRLNFMDPEAETILHRRLQVYLGLIEGEPPAPAVSEE